MITPHPPTIITTQPASSRKTNPQNKKHKIDMVNLKGKHPKTKRKLQNLEERKRERGRESFTMKLKPTPPLHHHNKPHQQPNLNPTKNPNPNTNHCETHTYQTQDPQPHDYPRPHKPNTTHIPTHLKSILREKERERERELCLMIGVAWTEAAKPRKIRVRS